MDEPFLRVQSRLTDRDHVLLGWLADHGVLTTDQINHALYGSLDFAQRRLRKLCQVGLLGRFRPFRAEGGTYPYHYLLGQLGVEIVAAHRGEDLPRKDQARRRRWHLTNRANLPHLLGVNGFFTDLAGYARTHPEASLDRWWPAARYQRSGGFAESGDPVQVLVYTPRVRPDGHGIWTEHSTSLPFFVEYDTGTEPLPVLVDKIAGYQDLARVTGRVPPLLFWLHSTAREHHLHTRLAEADVWYPIATAARDSAAQRAATPADDIWWLHRRPGARLRLAGLARTLSDTEQDQAA
ncbi:replication-relaxation family protein [Plantactinospora sp. ZYX-F-223]|uniref:replication-relaxation family protein n=1 Tax=Plantactinospora sp. ZYX-F-223 TaxID=3144103 RepID=UPI0031FD8EBF